MKHARPDYQRIQDPAGLIPADEPVFLLRAKDKAAPAAVEAWAERAELEGAATELVDSALHHANAMRDWQQQHGGGKVPDAPQVWDKDGVPLETLGEIKARAEAVQKHRRGSVVLDCSTGPNSLHSTLTLPDGTNLGRYATKIGLDIIAGQPNKLVVELYDPSVIALVQDYQLVMESEAALEQLRQVITLAAESGVDMSAANQPLQDIQNMLLTTKAMMRTPKQVLHGKTLRQWCAEFGITDPVVVDRAEAINETDPDGLRVFPDGTAWMAIGPDYQGGPEDRCEFAETPELAIQEWHKEFGQKPEGA